MTKAGLLTANTQLVQDNAKLQVELSEAKRAANDEYIRKEFAKAFDWYKSSLNSYSSEPEPLTPSWSKIFTKVGGLLDHVNDNNRLLNIENTLEHYNVQLQELKEKK